MNLICTIVYVFCLKATSDKCFFFLFFSYMPLWDNIDERWDRKILRPLHAAAYYLNPQFHYNPNFKEDFEVKHGLHESIYKMVTKQDWPKVDPILEDFKHARNYFGKELAKVAI